MTRGHGVRDGGGVAFGQQGDGSFGRSQQLPGVRVQVAQLASYFQVGDHEGQWFFFPVFPAPQRLDRLGVRRVTCQMETADPFNGHHASLLQPPRGSLDGILPAAAVAALNDGGIAREMLHRERPGGVAARVVLWSRDQPHSRAAGGAGVGLSVEAAVGRIVVFGLASRAHGKPGHRRRRPVVGDVGDDGEAGAAVGAVGERIAVAAVAGIEHLPQARQSRQTARSGEISAVRWPSAALGRITKAGYPAGRLRSCRQAVTVATGGARRGISARNAFTAWQGPSTSRSTPLAELPTVPLSP